MKTVLRCAAALVLAMAPAGPAAPPVRAEAAGGWAALAPAVGYRELTVRTAHGAARVHAVRADLRRPGVRADLLFPGAVAARAPLTRLAGERGAVAAVNGDFFDITEAQHPGVQATGAASGPAVHQGRALKAAVPEAQRFGWRPPPGDSDRDVLGVGVDGVARTARLTLRGHLWTTHGVRPLGGLNQYALPVGSIGAFTSDWGGASRARAACGNDESRQAPCTADTWEVTVRHGRVVAASATPGSGPIPAGSTVLLGREAGARALAGLPLGSSVAVDYRLASSEPVPFAFALGAYPLLRGGSPLAGLDSTDIEPRSAIGLADGGRTLTLLSTDGREGTSTGLTLTELARVVSDLGCPDGVYLDGGASATLVARDPATGHLTVRNHLDHDQERPVPNALAVFAGQPPTRPTRPAPHPAPTATATAAAPAS
ncbi:phosphodiester glycosidase family protein [Kitasatospora sp. NPDC059648]|uniref:phosphodiester glycosidase family protein n=1 Tax=Kitasatospora sp. NPDC059648 TaxID=3346894 RepID=UPI0036C402D9